MKCSFVFLLTVIALVEGIYAQPLPETSAHTDEWKKKTQEEVKAIYSECLAENHLNNEIIEKMSKWEFPEVDAVRTHILCTNQKLGIFCTDEGYHADRIIKQLNLHTPEDEALKIINACIDKNEQKTSNEEWAFRGHKCIIERLVKRQNILTKKA